MPSGYFDTEYTITKTIPALSKEYDAVEIVYRPVPFREQWLHNKQITQFAIISNDGVPKKNEDGAFEIEDVEAVSRLIRMFLVLHLVSWDLEDRFGVPIPIAFEELANIHPGLMREMMKEILHSIDV